jgi:hypothetical protein
MTANNSRSFALALKKLEWHRQGGSVMAQEINVLALVKGEEKYIFLFDDSRRAETLRMLGRFAADPNLSFSWYDAAVLGQKVRQSIPTSDESTIEAMTAAILPTQANNRSRRFNLPTS